MGRTYYTFYNKQELAGYLTYISWFMDSLYALIPGWILSQVPVLGSRLLAIGGGLDVAVSIIDARSGNVSFSVVTTATAFVVDAGFRRIPLNSPFQQNIMIGANHFLHNGISVPLQATGYKIGN